MFWLTRHKPKTAPFRCGRCGSVLGYSDGHRLFIGNQASVRKPITLDCRCGAYRKWRPWVLPKQQIERRKKKPHNSVDRKPESALCV